MKILYIVTQSHWGGAQRYVFDLAKNFSRENDITVACGGNGLLIDKLKSVGVKVEVFSNLIRKINPVKDFFCFWQLYNFIKKNKFDLVHTNSSKAEILGNAAAKLAGVKKIIFTAHGFVFNEPLKKTKKLFFVFLEKFANLFSDKIITVSDFDRNSAVKEKIAKPEKLVTIHNGVEPATSEISCLTRSEFNLSPDAEVVLTVANFYPVKGLKYLIRAAKLVCEKKPEVSFLIFGDGQLRPEIEQQIKNLNLEKKVILAGFQKNIFSIFPIADIFVMSSLKEGLPYAVLEAQAFGLPVVATNVGGLPEIIADRQTGFLVEPKNADKLAEKILLLLENEQLKQEFAQKAKQKINSHFNLSQMLKKTKSVYG